MDHLLEAARAVGVRRFVAQSFAAWVYARTDGPVKVETDPVEADQPSSVRQTLAAILHVERTLSDATDVEGSRSGTAGSTARAPRSAEDGAARDDPEAPLPDHGGGAGVWSFIHIDDAAAATVAAIEGGRPGIYNVTDDEPAPVRCGCRNSRRPRRTAAMQGARVARSVHRRRDRRGDDDRRAWRFEREGQARVGVEAAVRLLAGRLPSRSGVTSVAGGPGDRPNRYQPLVIESLACSPVFFFFFFFFSRFRCSSWRTALPIRRTTDRS